MRVFVLEADFGGGQQVNEFILKGKGTAEEAVDALDFGIYQTEQMAELVEWLHDYNRKADEAGKIHFYGNDMQRYDYSRKGLLDYFEAVNAEGAKKYSAVLEELFNKTVYELTDEQLEKADAGIAEILSELKIYEKKYIERSSSEAFILASQYATVLKQRTQLLLEEGNYM